MVNEGLKVGYNLTDKQKSVIPWMVEANRKGELDDEFSIAWTLRGRRILAGHSGVEPSGEQPEITPALRQHQRAY